MQRYPVHVIDDDPEIVRSLCFLLRAEGFTCQSNESAEEFLEELPERDPGPILLDLRLGGMSGLELQEELNARKCRMPVVVLTGHGDVENAVAAMKKGAVDFIQKPFAKGDLLEALQTTFEHLQREERTSAEQAKAVELVATLTSRERQILEGLAHGKLNKNIAYDLGISPRTIEIHRSNAMRKMNAKTLSEMLHIAFLAGVMDD